MGTIEVAVIPPYPTQTGQPTRPNRGGGGFERMQKWTCLPQADSKARGISRPSAISKKIPNQLIPNQESDPSGRRFD